MKTNQPKQYQQGYGEFYKLKFLVTSNVLIPRPETELLVDAVLEFAGNNPLTILDLGTGAGAIAIALAKNNPNLKILATDISEEALKVAEKNAKLHGVSDKITFIKSDLLQNIESNIDVIVTNLPYIPTSRIPYLDESVKDFEPHIALDGGEDGFELYRKLFEQIVEKNSQPKLLLGEIDYTHGELASHEAYNFFPKSIVEVKKDLAHLQRILKIKFTD